MANDMAGRENNGTPDGLITEAKRSYCMICQGRDMLIVMTIRVRCGCCGRMRVSQRRIEQEYGR